MKMVSGSEKMEGGTEIQFATTPRSPLLCPLEDLSHSLLEDLPPHSPLKDLPHSSVQKMNFVRVFAQIHQLVPCVTLKKFHQKSAMRGQLLARYSEGERQ